MGREGQFSAQRLRLRSLEEGSPELLQSYRAHEGESKILRLPFLLRSCTLRVPGPLRPGERAVGATASGREPKLTNPARACKPRKKTAFPYVWRGEVKKVA
jgi:hypothetical protein